VTSQTFSRDSFTLPHSLETCPGHASIGFSTNCHFLPYFVSELLKPLNGAICSVVHDAVCNGRLSVEAGA
jgi:hypothetical protein